MYPKGQEKEAAQNLVNFWGNLTTHDVYKDWPLGIAQGLAEKGFYNNEEFENTIKKFFTKPLVRNITMTITNYDSG